MKKFSLLLALAALTGAAHADILFDSITGISGYSYSTSTPHNLMGQGVTLGGSGAGSTTISGMDFAFVSQAAATYTNIEFDITFFGGVSNSVSGTTAAFTNPLASYFLTTGAVNLAAGTVYTYGSVASTTGAVTFSPFTVSNSAGPLGVQILARTNTGSGLTNDQNITFALRTTTPAAVGSIPGFYYRNASQTAPTNANTSLIGSDARNIGANSAMALRFYGTPQVTPEPSAFAALGLGAVAVLRRRKRA